MAALVVLNLVRFCPRYFGLCVIYAVVELCLIPIPVGIATRQFFESLSSGPSVWTVIGALVALQAAPALMGPLLRNPWSSMQQKSHVLLRHNMFAAVMRGFGRQRLSKPVGAIINRFRDDPEYIGDALDAVCDLTGRSLFAIVAAVLMWRINPLLTVVVLVPLLLSSYLSEALGSKTMAARAAARAATGQVTTLLAELLSGQLALSVAGAVPHAVERLTELGDARRRLAVRDRVFGELLNSLSVNIAHVATGIVLLVGARAIPDGTFSVGDFALFVLYLEQLGWYRDEIGRLVTDLKRVDVSFRRMHALTPYEAPSVLVDRAAVPWSGGSLTMATAGSPGRERLERLEVRGLTAEYANGGRGIVDASFAIQRGSFTVITGRIGSGKTTLVEALLGLLPRQSGEIRWNGHSVEDPASFFVPPRSA